MEEKLEKHFMTFKQSETEGKYDKNIKVKELKNLT
jgi:hypothetical protein